MNLEEYFKIIDLEEINRFIEDGQEENLTLEFKTVNHPNYNENNREFDKINISEVFSGFANSSGGIVVWGIKAKENNLGQDVAKNLKPINELTKFLNLLNRLEGQAVIPPINGIIHEKIEISEDKGYIKSFIPKSNTAPHMAVLSGKHYYKRSGDSFYQCEHYDIADMFSRKKVPSLRISWRKLINGRTSIQGRRYTNYKFVITLHNDGKTIAKYPSLALKIDGAHAESFGIDGNGNHGLNKTTRNPFYDHNYIGGSDKVIYPDLPIDIDHFFTQVEDEQDINDIEIQYLISAENMENRFETLIIKDKDLR